MDYLTPKAPGDSVQYVIDWAHQIGAADCISTFTLTVTSGTVTIVPTPENSRSKVFAVIAGGANGETAVLSCAIVTVGGQVLARALSLPIASASVSVTPSTATKQTVVEMAFEEIGLAGYEFDSTREEQASALRRLDLMLAEWAGMGLVLDYNAPLQVGGSLMTDAAGLPDDSLNAVALSLAMRVAPAIGKTMSAESRAAYAASMNALRARYGPKVQRPIPSGTVLGAGHKRFGTWGPFTGLRIVR